MIDLKKLLHTYGLTRHIPQTPEAICRVYNDKFTYIYAESTVDEEDIERCEALGVAPAWSDVCYSLDPTSHVQATAVDGSSKKQYLYHPQRSNIRRKHKSQKLLDAKNQLTAIRSWYRTCFDTNDDLISALIIALIDLTGKRVGSHTSKHHGIVSLHTDHVSYDEGVLHGSYTGKGGTSQSFSIDNPEIVKTFRHAIDLGDTGLLWGEDDEQVTSSQIRETMRTIPTSWTPKDLRMRNATLTFYEAWIDGYKKSEAIKLVAQELGNTPAISKKYYIPLSLQEAWMQDDLDQLHQDVLRTRSTKYLTQNEHRLWKILVLLDT